MPPRQRTTAGTGADPSGDPNKVSEELFDPPAPGELEADSELATFLGSIDADSGAKVFVYRIIPNKANSFVTECGPGDFSLTRLRDDHGGGEFRIMAYVNGRLIANKRVSVEAPPPPKTLPVPASAPAMHGTIDLEAVMERQAERSRMLMLELVNTMLRAQQGSQRSNPRDEFIEMFNLVKGIAPPAQPPALGMDQFMAGINFAKDLVEDQGDESGVRSIAKLAETYLPQIIGAVKAATPPKPIAPNAPRPEGGPSMNPMMMLLKSHLIQLEQQAKANVPSASLVEIVIDGMPPKLLDQLLTMPDPVAELAKIHPPIIEIRTWVEGLIREIRDALTAEEEGGDDAVDGSPSGNPPTQN